MRISTRESVTAERGSQTLGQAGKPPAPSRRWWNRHGDWGARVGLFILVAMVASAAAAPFLAPYNPTEQSLRLRAQGPSLAHPLGMDELGRDILSRLLYGARYTLGGSLVAVLLAAGIGVGIGLAVGYVGGVLDEVVMRTMDGLLAFPYIVVAVFLSALLGPGLIGAIVAIGLSSAPGYVRLVRGIVLTVRAQEHIGAAVACGASGLRIAFRHILPNSISPVIVYASLDAAGALIRLSTLSFIGMGAQPPAPEWGTMLNTAQEWLAAAPHISIAPGLAIVVAAVSFNLVGEALRDALDPRIANERPLT